MPQPTYTDRTHCPWCDWIAYTKDAMLIHLSSVHPLDMARQIAYRLGWDD